MQRDKNKNIRELLDFISKAAKLNEPIALFTEIGNEDQRLAVTRNGRSAGQLQDEWPISKEEIIPLFKNGGQTEIINLRPQSGSESERRLIYEIIKPKTQLIIFGAGHVGHSLAVAGAFVGYDVMVIDDRAEFASYNRFDDPRINTLVRPFENAIEEIRLDAYSAVAIVTRGHQYDELCLRKVIDSEARYIGMIGSKRRVASIFARLRETGTENEKLSRVRAPIGVEICARTPQEIAISILAEIIQVMNCD